MNFSKETKPPDRVGNKGMMRTIDSTETTHVGMVKIMPDLKKVRDVK